MISHQAWHAMYVDIRRRVEDARNPRGTVLKATIQALEGMLDEAYLSENESRRGLPARHTTPGTWLHAYQIAMYLSASLKEQCMLCAASEEALALNVQYETSIGIALGLRLLIDRAESPEPIRDDTSDPGA